MNPETFIRVLKLDSVNTTLNLCQQQVGDVNCVVWDAAIVLSKYLDTLCSPERLGINWLRDKRVLELGAGIGCVGMTAACLGANVVITDLASALPMLEKNILLNKTAWSDAGGSVVLKDLEWGKEINIEFHPDIILLADCVYYSESVQPLIDTLVFFCQHNRSIQVILCQEERDTPRQKNVWEEFFRESKKKFHLEYVPLSQQHPIFSSEDINLIKLTYL